MAQSSVPRRAVETDLYKNPRKIANRLLIEERLAVRLKMEKPQTRPWFVA